MELFHGTSKSRGDIIVEEGKISCHAKLMYEDGGEDVLQSAEFSNGLIKPTTLATTPGYIYLTNSIFKAAYYGNINAVSGNEDSFYLFKVELPETLLEPDEDEIRMALCQDPGQYPRAIDSLSACHSARYNRDIITFEYCVLPSTTNFSDPLRELVMNVILQRPRPRESNMRQLSMDLLNQFHSKIEWTKG